MSLPTADGPSPTRASNVDVLAGEHRSATAPAPRVELTTEAVSTWPWLWPVVSYLATRAALLVLAGLIALDGHHSITSELSGFDGGWYLRLVDRGYPTYVTHAQSTLGFFPLYPMVVRALDWLTLAPVTVVALIVSFAGGLVATVLVERLATKWWGEQIGPRAAIAFVLFPGSVVFSMAYSECLTIPLIVGCLLCVSKKRWIAAGLLAGMATAVEPAALAMIVVLAVVALRELRAHGFADRSARRSLLAPLLSTLGIGGFGIFLWVWTGTPFATLAAQHYGWHQQNGPFGIFGQPIVRHLIASPGKVVAYLPSWNLWSGIVGAMFLALSLVALYRVRKELTAGAFGWVVGIAVLTLWSVMTPPKARLLLIAFPAVIVWARRLNATRLAAFFAAESAVFVIASALTLSGHMLP
ncbi:MAG: hypothetical protein WB770_11700 [Acidimicrobiales bacterium]